MDGTDIIINIRFTRISFLSITCKLALINLSTTGFSLETVNIHWHIQVNRYHRRAGHLYSHQRDNLRSSNLVFSASNTLLNLTLPQIPLLLIIKHIHHDPVFSRHLSRRYYYKRQDLGMMYMQTYMYVCLCIRKTLAVVLPGTDMLCGGESNPDTLPHNPYFFPNDWERKTTTEALANKWPCPVFVVQFSTMSRGWTELALAHLSLAYTQVWKMN